MLKSKLRLCALIVAALGTINCFALVAFLDVTNNSWKDGRSPDEKGLVCQGHWHVVVLNNMQPGHHYEFQVANKKKDQFIPGELLLKMKRIEKGSEKHFQNFTISEKNGIISFNLANDAPNEISVSFDIERGGSGVPGDFEHTVNFTFTKTVDAKQESKADKADENEEQKYNKK